jgi:hypothetical protein
VIGYALFLLGVLQDTCFAPSTSLRNSTTQTAIGVKSVEELEGFTKMSAAKKEQNPFERVGVVNGKMPDPPPAAVAGPGPIYLPRGVGGIGVQNLSTLSTQPRILIGTAPRWASSKNADQGPGPGAYEVKAQKGPSYSIRSREKFGSQMNTTKGEVPGPGTHKRLETGMTRKKNAPAYSLKPRRVITSTADFTPAPGHTQHIASASEKQVLSTKSNLPSMKFGTGGRDSKEEMPSTGDIGPGEYRPNFQSISDYPNVPGYTMAGRWKPIKGNRIEPELRMLPAGIGKQVSSTIRSAPAFSMSGRTKFGSPYVI